ncbi:hypothetical protein GWK47_001402 [Chionoecetes opilio]|uniref:Uncharacterized protein n=1 Tax=Chionoecetes opilio TaxID=41210 RepID=A0A8J4Y1N5_CHIOP|nr:hypothetical protein GWK47_001402 [Chionoecetes opilio]
MEVLSEVFDTKLAKINVICMQNGIATFNQPLLEYILENRHCDERPKGFKARFLSLFDQMDFLMATAIQPLFKMPVVRLLNPAKALRSPGSTTTEGTNCARLSNKMGKELESWCLEKQRNKLLEQAMFPALSRAA